MTPQDFEKAMFARTVWMLARSDDVNELSAIACTIRNHIFSRPGQPATYFSYMDACQGFMKAYPLRQEPTFLDKSFTTYPDGLLCIIDDIYSCQYPDLTATASTPGARYFAKAGDVLAKPDHWLYDIVCGHQPIGIFGSQQFYA